MSSRYITTEVEVDLSDFDTQDLLDELDSRGSLPADVPGDSKDLVEAIWLRRRNGKNYDDLVDKLIYNVTGHVI
ncbi:hypothetical protein N9972_01145 [bacterium]|nr:hypothetical protein [bacterium]